MCGIAGVRRFGNVPITPEEVNILLMSIEHRGNHATGIATVGPNGIEVCKAPVPAWSFCSEQSTKDFLAANLPDAHTVLLHTRWATVGSPENNDNNHPMFAGRAAVVHNGGISNHAYMFNEMKVARASECDSDVFRAAIDKEGLNENSIKLMNKFSGSAAIAAATTDDPDLLLLARSGSPLVYGICENEDKLWWASELHAIQKAVRPWEKIRGLYGRRFRHDVAYFTVPDNTAYILTAEGLDRKFEFKLCTHYRAPNYNARGTYYSQTEKWRRGRRNNPPVTFPVKVEKGPHKMGKCPGCDDKYWIEVDKKFANFTCSNPQCKRSLAPLDFAKPEDLQYGDFNQAKKESTTVN